jgi:hypothetical protein
MTIYISLVNVTMMDLWKNLKMMMMMTIEIKRFTCDMFVPECVSELFTF